MKSTDTVKAKLTPREAILNRNAAELLGRHNIARLNAHGNMLAKRGVDLASDPGPHPAGQNLEGYQMGSSMVGRDDKTDLLAEANNTFYGGGQAPMPTPTPTPIPQRYQYGTEDVRRRRNAASRVRFPQGQIIQGSGAGSGGYGIGRGALSPEDNPAYQAAIARPRAGSDAYSWITTPSGGQMKVPTASLGNLLRKGSDLADSQVTQIGNQLPINYATEKAKGFGAPSPVIQGGYQIARGVANPIENLTPQQRIAGGAGSGLDFFRSNPALTAGLNLARSAASRIAGLFGGGNPLIPSANAGQPSPTPTPYQTPQPIAPLPTPTPTIPPDEYPGYQFGTANVMPRRYSDYY